MSWHRWPPERADSHFWSRPVASRPLHELAGGLQTSLFGRFCVELFTNKDSSAHPDMTIHSRKGEVPVAARAGTAERSTMVPEGRVQQETRNDAWRGTSGTEGLDVLMGDASRHRSVAAVSRDLGHEIKSVLNVVDAQSGAALARRVHRPAIASRPRARRAQQRRHAAGDQAARQLHRRHPAGTRPRRRRLAAARPLCHLPAHRAAHRLARRPPARRRPGQRAGLGSVHRRLPGAAAERHPEPGDQCARRHAQRRHARPAGVDRRPRRRAFASATPARGCPTPSAPTPGNLARRWTAWASAWP